MIKIIIAGSRGFDQYVLLSSVCDDVLPGGMEYEIVSGCARGADKLGETYAWERGWPVTQFPADWDTHGRAAGYIRNEEMARYADALIVFWNGKSRGTKYMIDLAHKHRLLTYIHRYDEDSN